MTQTQKTQEQCFGGKTWKYIRDPVSSLRSALTRLHITLRKSRKFFGSKFPHWYSGGAIVNAHNHCYAMLFEITTNSHVIGVQNHHVVSCKNILFLPLTKHYLILLSYQINFLPLISCLYDGHQKEIGWPKLFYYSSILNAT